MQNVVQEINDDYQQQIDTTKANLSHDVLEMSGSRAVWPEVLAVYAVKTTTDPDNPQEVATIDDSKKAILTDIFWEMNQISSRTETRTETVITETDDGHGNIVETESTVTQRCLETDGCHLAIPSDEFFQKVIVIKPKVLKPEFQLPTRQLYVCTGGFGAYPKSRGSACFCTSLYSGKHTRFEREDILATMDIKAVPQWAQENLRKALSEEKKLNQKTLMSISC